MGKKPFLFIVVFFLLGFGYWYFTYVFGWMEFRWNTDTPKNFLSYNVIKKESYSKDSIIVMDSLQRFLHNHEQSFYNKDYSDSTQLIIDTILYSSDFNKLAAFVIAKNPIDGQLDPNLKYQWHYNGYCYVGVRESNKLNLNWIGVNYTNYHDKQDISSALKEYYFRHFTEIKDTAGVSLEKYNLNDKRFWSGPVWKEIKEKQEREVEFQKEKKEHPENVYEPK